MQPLAEKPVSSPINLPGPLGPTIKVAPVVEVVAMPRQETVSEVMTSPARLPEPRRKLHVKQVKRRQWSCKRF